MNNNNEIDWKNTIQQVEEYIRAYISSFLTVKQIALDFNIAKRKLEDHFKYHIGKTIKCYILDEKIKFVSEMLSDKKEVGNYFGLATESGFKDIASLNYLIKVKTGMTLQEYHEELLMRKKCKKCAQI